MLAWGILTPQYPYPSTNTSYRTFNSEEVPEDEEDDQKAVDIGIQEAKKIENVEEDEEYMEIERECQKLRDELVNEFKDVF